MASTPTKDDGDDDEDFSAFRSPGGKDAVFSAPSPGAEASDAKDADAKALAPYEATQVDVPKDIGGGYKELTQGYMESLVAAAANPATPCQLIDAKVYKQLAKTILAVDGDDRKQLEVWTLGHGGTGIKKFIKSDKAKETLAGLKLCELLMAQIGESFARELTSSKWAERLYGCFYDTGEPILKMTIAQHIADWLEMFGGSSLDVKHLRTVAKKIAKNALTNGGYGIPKPTAMALKFSVGGGKPSGKKPADAKPAASPAKEEEDVDDAPVREEESPMKKAPQAVTGEKATRATVISTAFKRYDLDKSGSINTTEELEQLCTNLCFKLKILVPPDAVEKKVNELGDMESREFNIGEFTMWFDEAFDQKNIKL